MNQNEILDSSSINTLEVRRMISSSSVLPKIDRLKGSRSHRDEDDEEQKNYIVRNLC